MLRRLESFNGYATGDLPSAWSAQSGAPAVSSGGYGGGNRLVLGSADYVEQLFDAQAAWIPGAGITIGSLSSAAPLFALLDGATIQVWVRVETDGTIKAYRGSGTSNLLGTSTGVTISAAVRFHLEVKAVIHPSAGTLEVRVNGVARLALTGLNTRASANSYATIVRLQGSAGSGGVSYENLNIKDGQAAPAGAPADTSTFVGDCRVKLRLPVADGTTHNFTPSSGSIHAVLIDDAPPTGDADYVSSATPGDRDLFTFAPYDSLGTIYGEQVRFLVRKDDAGARSVKVTMRPGSTNYDAAAYAVASSYTYAQGIWEANPDTTTPFTLTTLNASQRGVKLES